MAAPRCQHCWAVVAKGPHDPGGRVHRKVCPQHDHDLPPRPTHPRSQGPVRPWPVGISTPRDGGTCPSSEHPRTHRLDRDRRSGVCRLRAGQRRRHCCPGTLDGPVRAHARAAPGQHHQLPGPSCCRGAVGADRSAANGAARGYGLPSDDQQRAGALDRPRHRCGHPHRRLRTARSVVRSGDGGRPTARVRNRRPGRTGDRCHAVRRVHRRRRHRVRGYQRRSQPPTACRGHEQASGGRHCGSADAVRRQHRARLRRRRPGSLAPRRRDRPGLGSRCWPASGSPPCRSAT